jgi:hypothetical protein
MATSFFPLPGGATARDIMEALQAEGCERMTLRRVSFALATAARAGARWLRLRLF